MHSYSIDSNERKILPFFFALISIALFLFTYWVLKVVEIEIPWWIPVPSAFCLYGLIYWVFESWLWRIKLFKTIRIVKTKDIAGNWNGVLTSSYDNQESKEDVEVKEPGGGHWLVCKLRK